MPLPPRSCYSGRSAALRARVGKCVQGASGSPLVEVIIGDNEAFEDALKRFNKGVMREGILKEARRRTRYEKPSEKRKRIEAARERKRRKKLRRERARAMARR